MNFRQLQELYEDHLRDRTRMTRWEALAQAIADMIRTGALAPGERLPTHRELAGFLGVTVGTVSRAYARTAQLNLSQGIVGRGTFVVRPVQEVDVYAHMRVSALPQQVSHSHYHRHCRRGE